MLSIYRIVINLIILLSPFIIFFRILKNKEHSTRFKEKFCFFSQKKNKGKLIWFHGASVGEILSVIPLIEKLEKNKKVKQILVTSNTLSSSKILSDLKFKKTIHQFFPIDSNYLTKKFLDYWKPSVAIFIDSEIWPNMLINIKNKVIPLMLINARITKKTFKKWRIFPLNAKKNFQKFDSCFASSLESKKYLELLGVKNIRFIGNLKFSQIEKDRNFLNIRLKKFFASKKIWCASSTHESEEKICITVHKKLKLKYKNLLTIIIPRHIDRTNSIIEEINNLNLKFHLHDSKKKIDGDTDIYLINSYGNTKSFFKVCKTVFLGGSIIKHGGQNPLEAARYGCKILHGPNVWNFHEIYQLLNKFNVSTKIYNSNQLMLNIRRIINQKHNSIIIKKKIKYLGNKILYSTLKEINFFIDKK